MKLKDRKAPNTVFFVGTYTQKKAMLTKQREFTEIPDADNKKMEIIGVIEDLVNPANGCQVDSSNLLTVNEMGQTLKIILVE